MRMKKNNIVSLVLMLALVLCVSVGATLAYIAKQTDDVTNTFVMTLSNESNIDLILTETVKDYNPDGTERLESGLTGQQTVRVTPDKPMKKNPDLTAPTANDAPAYIYLKVELQGDMTMADFADLINDPTYFSAPADKGWFLISDPASTDKIAYYGHYQTRGGNKPYNDQQGGPFKDGFTVSKAKLDADPALKTKLENTKMVFTGYAIEADASFTDSRDAWNQGKGKFGL